MPNPRRTVRRKKVTGTFRPDRAAQQAGERLKACPPPPKHLSAGAAVEWRRLAPVAHRLGTVTAGDLRAFELLCDTLASASEAAEIVRRDGMTLATGSGGTRSHPAVKVLETARAQATRLLIEFGLTPRARGHVEEAPLRGRGNDFGRIDEEFLSSRSKGRWP